MIYENDKLNIPEKYSEMSVSELRYEKEKIYMQLKNNKHKKENCGNGKILFKF